MATAAAGRGPLNWLLKSTAGQYALLGGGGMYLAYPEQIRQIIAKYGSQEWADYLPSSASSTASPVPQIITIQTPGNNTLSTSKPLTVILYAAAGAGVCWLGYIVATNIDALAAMLPVTKEVFQKATKALGKSIMDVKEAIEEQISNLMKKQDQLSDKQDATNRDVRLVSNNLDEARGDLRDVKDSLGRCEDTLDKSHASQNYTKRGVQLLVRCVTAFMPQDGDYLDEIARYMRDGESSDLQESSNSVDRRNRGSRSSINKSQSQISQPPRSSYSDLPMATAVVPHPAHPGSSDLSEVSPSPYVVSARYG